MTEYLQMPPLYELDDYDVCMKMYPERKATYCVVKVLIKPDKDSETWRYIEVIHFATLLTSLSPKLIMN